MTNGYCKITIKGSEVGLKFAWPGVTEFLVEAARRKDVYYTGDGDNEQITDYGMGRLLLCAYKNNCLLKEIEPVLTFEDFVEWVEERIGIENDTSIKEVWTCFAESSVLKKITEGQKKSQTEIAPTIEESTSTK